MGAIESFFEYAQEFEKTFVDDDWSRLERFFAPDAVYEVRGASFACRLETPSAIFRGIKKSLDGFDRRLSKRDIAIVDPPVAAGERVSIGWTVTYGKAGVPDLVLRGRTSARLRDGRIVELVDEYGAGVDAELRRWVKHAGEDLSPAYT